MASQRIRRGCDPEIVITRARIPLDAVAVQILLHAQLLDVVVAHTRNRAGYFDVVPVEGDVQILDRFNREAHREGVGDFRAQVRVAAKQGVVLVGRVGRHETVRRGRQAGLGALRRRVARVRTAAEVDGAAQCDALRVIHVVEAGSPHGAVVTGTCQQLVVQERSAQADLVGVVSAGGVIRRIAVAQRGIQAIERTTAHVNRQSGFDEEVGHAVRGIDRQVGGAGTGEVAGSGVTVIHRGIGVLAHLCTHGQADFLAICAREAPAQGAGGFRRQRAVAGPVDAEAGARHCGGGFWTDVVRPDVIQLATLEGAVACVFAAQCSGGDAADQEVVVADVDGLGAARGVRQVVVP